MYKFNDQLHHQTEVFYLFTLPQMQWHKMTLQ